MAKPDAVIISDIHFTVSTLELATKSLEMAMSKAAELKVPLIIAGDTLDSKALIRAEVANRLIEVLCGYYREHLFTESIYLMVGNHDLLNEKGKEHSLNFLKPYCNVVQSYVYEEEVRSWLIPYISDPEELQQLLNKIPKGSRLIMHTGVMGANMGHYVVDKTSLPKEAFADFRVISGHYHRAQEIKCGRPRKGAVGLFSYIGNPYSLSFGEAEDGPKGFRILMDDGTLESVPTNLRKHVVLETSIDNWWEIGKQDPANLLWLKISGCKSELDSLTKEQITNIVGHSNYKLDLTPTDSMVLEEQKKPLSEAELFDTLIDNTSETKKQKEYLKGLWRTLVS